jgi:hypothetical protein
MDLAYALTEGREPINPRPIDQVKIFRAYEKAAIGFITYSEGCNDDVNKFIWSGLGWNPQIDVTEILSDYSRYFVGSQYENSFARGLLALEQNWRGPLLKNEGVYKTLKQFQEMEQNARPQVLLNWRFQQALYRAYYDAYTRARLIFETNLEERAMDILRTAPKSGSLEAMKQAEAILNQSDTQQTTRDWRVRIFQLAEALFQSIRMQLSTDLYQARSTGRGANLDEVDRSLNNKVWLEKEMAKIRGLTKEKDRLGRIETIVNWEDPGPGGFYDDLGSLTNQPHLVKGEEYEKDPGFYKSALVGHRPKKDWRTSWSRHADAMFDLPLELHYTDLSRTAEYKVRLVYAGGTKYHGEPVLVKFKADNFEIHPMQPKPKPIGPVEFDIPKEATSDGSLSLTWYSEPGKGVAGRGVHLGEVWLIKKE